MSEIWKAGKDVHKALTSLISQYHPHLVDVEDQILVIFKEKASTPGGQVIAGKSKKAPALLAAGIVTENKHKWTFIIELAADVWKVLDDKQKTALLDHHLCSMIATENPQTGAMSYGIKPPDFTGYREEIERWGLWRPQSDANAGTLVEQMFGRAQTTAAEGEGDDDVVH